MFNFSSLEQLHLEITTNCQASCPFCPRNYHGHVSNPLLKIENWSFEDFKKLVTDEVLTQIKGLSFLGNYGDCILNNDLIKMCEYVKEKAPHIYVKIHTNGGARDKKWWATLYNALPKKHLVLFGIDGLDDTHHLHRINVSFKKVIENSTEFISHGGHARWIFISFKHNEHQINEARKMAQEIGFSSFVIKQSNRFFDGTKHNVLDKDGSVLYTIEPPSDNKMIFVNKKYIDNIDLVMNTHTVNCEAIKKKEVYIDVFKRLFPCSHISVLLDMWLRDSDYEKQLRNKMVEELNEVISQLGGYSAIDVRNRSIKEILNSSEWNNVWKDNWDNKKIKGCVLTCGRKLEISNGKDQIIKTETIKINPANLN